MTAVTCVTNHLLVYRHLVDLRLAQHEYVGPGLADIITLPRALFTPRYLQTVPLLSYGLLVNNGLTRNYISGNP